MIHNIFRKIGSTFLPLKPARDLTCAGQVEEKDLASASLFHSASI